MSFPVSIYDLFELTNEEFKINRSPLLFIEKSPLGILFARKIGSLKET